MDIEIQLINAESKWYKPAYRFLRKKFEKYPLPSHDHQHHARVWKYAKQLCKEVSLQQIIIPAGVIESLLLACLFHDSGMVREQGHEHGKAGVEIFREFLSTVKDKPVNPLAIEEAIERHDDKTYSGSKLLISENSINLLPALHISDDLDALGYIGIYRYTEIYLLRGIPMEDLGLKIIANLSARYGNFIRNCSRLPEMLKYHIPRHHTIESFFRLYNLQIRKMEATGQIAASGPVNIIKHLYREVLIHTPSLEKISDNILSSTKDAYIQDFFKELKNELQK